MLRENYGINIDLLSPYPIGSISDGDAAPLTKSERIELRPPRNREEYNFSSTPTGYYNFITTQSHTPPPLEFAQPSVRGTSPILVQSDTSKGADSPAPSSPCPAPKVPRHAAGKRKPSTKSGSTRKRARLVSPEGLICDGSGDSSKQHQDTAKKTGASPKKVRATTTEYDFLHKGAMWKRRPRPCDAGGIKVPVLGEVEDGYVDKGREKDTQNEISCRCGESKRVLSSELKEWVAQCSVCLRWSHNACQPFGFVSAMDDKSHFVCHLCIVPCLTKKRVDSPEARCVL